MAIPTKYRSVAEPQFASYDFYDLFTGTGYKSFYPSDARSDASGALVYFISPQSVYADVGFVHDTTNPAEYNFDLLFEVPITISGTLTFNVPFGITGAGSMTATLNAIFYKVSGGVETQIGSTIYKTFTGASADTRIFSGKTDIATTRFRAGDTFRFSITIDTGADPQYVDIFFDPKNRTGTDLGSSINSTITQSIINLPIII